MMLPTINFNGGKRLYFNVQAKITGTTFERHWKNLWLKKTKKLCLEVVSEIPASRFENLHGNKVSFPVRITIHDFANELTNALVDDLLELQIGYADQNEQYWKGVNTFSASVVKNEQVLELV